MHTPPPYILETKETFSVLSKLTEAASNQARAVGHCCQLSLARGATSLRLFPTGDFHWQSADAPTRLWRPSKKYQQQQAQLRAS